MRKLRPGDKFRIRASDYNAMADAGQFVRDRMSMLAAGAPGIHRDTIKIYNAGGIVMPRFGLVWLTGMEAEDVFTAQRPTGPDNAHVAITAMPLAVGQVGDAWVHGYHPVLCSDDLEDLSFPCHAVPQADSFYVTAYDGGPLRLLDFAIVASAPAEPLVMATFAELPIGVEGQMLYHDGTAWVPIDTMECDS